MKDSTMVKGGFWGGVIGAVTGLLGCAFGALSYFGLGPDVVRNTLGGWYHILFPVCMTAFGFLFGFSVRHLVERKARMKHDAALTAAEKERDELADKVRAQREEIAQGKVHIAKLETELATDRGLSVDEVRKAIAEELAKEDFRKLWTDRGSKIGPLTWGELAGSEDDAAQ